MKVMVTGGAGFIGSHIVDFLVSMGIETIVVDNFSTGRLDHLPKVIQYYNADIVSQELKEIFAMEQPEKVIHQAAQVDVQKSVVNPYDDAVQNLLGTINVLTCCRDYGVQKIIFASSCAVYGETPDMAITEAHPIRPSSFYGLSKYNGEQYVRLYQDMYGLPYTILRYANVYGPRQNSGGEGAVIPIFITKLLAGVSPVIYGRGVQTRDFVFVKDVAHANYLALQGADNTTVNIGTNIKTSISELYKMVAHALSSPLLPVHQPMKKGDLLFSCLQCEKAKEVLAWQPSVSLEEGLAYTIGFYKERR
ncbi:UDP-glucose 4-epimerase [Brevibacillus sp. AG162]|uniref:NAD-dependent epimerase/dehydratase family protein n=1 Tax=Brevibacillus sp. AG162 TaxID=2572910 RepID=UPI001154BC1B|nr:NAD-dependent epimerase/dehydratase family protein [Brevibacillus sp. AG162]TQK73475.1 UDP-glucose 4-epimerase [Brevibacillus sp. AG162]